MTIAITTTIYSVEIDLIHKGIKTDTIRHCVKCFFVEIDLIHKGIKTSDRRTCRPALVRCVEIDLIHKGIKTYCFALPS